jgi:hypothetical protein
MNGLAMFATFAITFEKVFLYSYISTTFIKYMANMAEVLLPREIIGVAAATTRGRSWQTWQDQTHI